MANQAGKREYSLPTCSHIYSQNISLGFVNKCEAKAPYFLNGKDYCKRHAKEAAFNVVFTKNT